jgi:phage baseplate assembly protein W
MAINVLKPDPVPIGITLPIRDSNTGFFEQSYDTLTQVRSNIINLLNTRPGERRMQPTFGCRLWNLIFEQNIDTLEDLSVETIRSDISSWIPNVSVINVTSRLIKSDKSLNNRDIYVLNISVLFMLNSTKQKDSVNILMDNIIT